MLFIPYSTDAPLYHWPIVTVSAIVINVAVFCLTTLQVSLGNLTHDQIGWLILDFDTINPLQWVTAAFMHADWMHLLGNMIFLWCFGLIVEGKLGNKWFAVLYLVLCLAKGSVTQVSMFSMGGGGGALGASGVIFALMAIAAIWAPENQMDCFFSFGFWYFRTVEVRVIALCGFYLAMQLLFFALAGFSMSSAALHLIGMVVGVPAGFLILRQGWVDGEGWDIVSRTPFLQQFPMLSSPTQQTRQLRHDQMIDDPIQAALALQPARATNYENTQRGFGQRRAAGLGDPAKAKDRTILRAHAPSPGTSKQVRSKREAGPVRTSKIARDPVFIQSRQEFLEAIESRDVERGYAAFVVLDQSKQSPALEEELLARYLALLAQSKAWVRMIRPLAIVGDLGGKKANDAWLKLAQIQLSVTNQPAFALKSLANIDGFTSASPAANAKKLTLKMNLQIAANKALGG